ncbi:MAG: hypothetical protein Tp1111DCM1126091_132 [Prokaryotic dsDNA virus sp.]|nr:MAG: hypothetical protein Tp1111DCM1126091_132 [Prokaryotic dsDNA virus sp.]|tara:strand:+ start:17275 stop:17520 length:246 start_codon:yes stop_codon:yes gene_type:complete
MTKKTLVITHQSTLRDPEDNPKGTQVSYTVTIRGEQEYLQKKIDKVFKTGRPEYLETEQKTVLVMTWALLENSLVYFVEED